MYDVEIRDLPAQRLAVMQHQGACQKIGTAFDRLYGIIAQQNLWPHVGAGVAIYPMDPQQVPEEDLRSYAGVTLAKEASVPAGLEPYDLPAQRCAVLTYHGPYEQIGRAYGYLYEAWLASAGAEPRGAPDFEVYLNSPMDTAPQDLLTWVCVPLAG